MLFELLSIGEKVFTKLPTVTHFSFFFFLTKDTLELTTIFYL